MPHVYVLTVKQCYRGKRSVRILMVIPIDRGSVRNVHWIKSAIHQPLCVFNNSAAVDPWTMTKFEYGSGRVWV